MECLIGVRRSAFRVKSYFTRYRKLYLFSRHPQIGCRRKATSLLYPATSKQDEEGCETKTSTYAVPICDRADDRVDWRHLRGECEKES